MQIVEQTQEGEGRESSSLVWLLLSVHVIRMVSSQVAACDGGEVAVRSQHSCPAEALQCVPEGTSGGDKRG